MRVPDVLDTPAVLAGSVRSKLDERAARRTLLDQVARLEGELASVVLRHLAAHGCLTPTVAGRGGGPRLLSLAELEELRDELAARIVGRPPRRSPTAPGSRSRTAA